MFERLKAAWEKDQDTQARTSQDKDWNLADRREVPRTSWDRKIKGADALANEDLFLHLGERWANAKTAEEKGLILREVLERKTEDDEEEPQPDFVKIEVTLVGVAV